jgi:hypothetical protein
MDATALLPVLAASDITDARLRRLFEHWDARRRGARLPNRAAIDVVELKPWLGNLLLIEVIDGGRDFRYRVYGSTLAQYYGRDLTGKTIAEARAETREIVRSEYLSVVREGRPLLVKRDRPVLHRQARVAKLILPLTCDGSSVGMLLVGAYPES